MTEQSQSASPSKPGDKQPAKVRKTPTKGHEVMDTMNGNKRIDMKPGGAE